jgi:hypothetical protein
VTEFKEWPKTPRLFRDAIISEKIDGTNSGIHIEVIAPEEAAYSGELEGPHGVPEDMFLSNGFVVKVTAQSRKRLIYPGKQTDNYGFAEWVRTNGTVLADLIGPGLHMGEWWGRGINRGYGQLGRSFSLFNTDRYSAVDTVIGDVRVNTVPVLYHGTFSEHMIKAALADLSQNGSKAAPGYNNPEGIVVWHSQTHGNFKVTLDRQDAGKWEIAT